MKIKGIRAGIISLILLVAYLFEWPLRRIILMFNFELLTFIFPFAIFVCMLFVTKDYMSVGGVFKALCMSVSFLVIDGLISWAIELLNAVPIPFVIMAITVIYEIIKPVIFVAVILAVFRWISKLSIADYKPFVIPYITVFALGAISSIIYNGVFMTWNPENGIYFYQIGFSPLYSVVERFNFVSKFCNYAQAFLAFLLMLRLCPVIDKKAEIVIDSKLDSNQIPDGCWQCMGCGAVLSSEADRCDCGYKR